MLPHNFKLFVRTTRLPRESWKSGKRGYEIEQGPRNDDGVINVD